MSGGRAAWNWRFNCDACTLKIHDKRYHCEAYYSRKSNKPGNWDVCTECWDIGVRCYGGKAHTMRASVQFVSLYNSEQSYIENQVLYSH